MHINAAIIKQLEATAEFFPSPVYWLDTNNVVLGANSLLLKSIGASCLADIVGKTPYDFYPEKLAEHIVKFNEKVMTEGICLSQEEAIRDLQTGKIRYYTASKIPLRDDSGKIIGIVGSSIENTAEKEAEVIRLEALKKTNVLKHLELLAPLFPIPIYWMDLNNTVLGANQHTLSGAGLTSFNDLLGKTLYDLYPKEIAEHIAKHNAEVICTGQILSQEEPIKDMSTGRMRHYEAFKAPLRDEDGKIIGMLGISIETTAEKEAQQLKLESETQKVVLQEKEKFAILARKVAHDISSPLTALKMMIPQCDELPEDKRIRLNRATESIGDIANNLLNNSRRQKTSVSSEIEPRQPLLVSDLLIQLLSEKREQYRNQPVTFNSIISHDSQFAFIQCQAIEFRRAMSNLINNAVDAVKDKTDGIVTVKLTAYAGKIVVEVADNGRGMPSIMIERIRRCQSFTTGKENGHGLGLQQVWDTLEYNEGSMDVQSTPHQGTAVKIAFDMIAAPSWIGQEIHLIPNSIILILDDDESIHAAWDLRFSSLFISDPTLRLHHFTQGQEALDFLEGLSSKEKNCVVFLSDYELLHQDRNGLQIVKKSRIKRAMLVTSYYANPKIREETGKLGIKVLPKQMASVIPIYID